MDTVPATDYEIVVLTDGSFGVRITEPSGVPRTIGGFATRDEADGWIYEQGEPVPGNEKLPPVHP